MFFPFSISFVASFVILTNTFVNSIVLDDVLNPNQIACAIVNAARDVEFEFPPYKCIGECPMMIDGNVQMKFDCKTTAFELFPYFGSKFVVTNFWFLYNYN